MIIFLYIFLLVTWDFSFFLFQVYFTVCLHDLSLSLSLYIYIYVYTRYTEKLSARPRSKVRCILFHRVFQQVNAHSTTLLKVFLRIYIYIYIYIYLSEDIWVCQRLYTRMWHKVNFLRGVQLLWIWSFSSLKPVTVPRLKTPVCPTIDSMLGVGRINGFIPFPSVLAVYEMQKSPKICYNTK